MRDLFLLMMCSMFMGVALLAPFVAGLGYIWVDFIGPQRIGFSLLQDQPISLVMGLWTVLLYLILDRRNPPRISGILVLVTTFVIWTTLTTTWALVPEAAWAKWNSAAKAVAFTLLIPFLFRTSIRLEAMLLTLVFSVAATVIGFAVKVIVSGGGYGFQLGLFRENSLLGEGSTLSGTVLATVPIALAFSRGSKFFPWPLASAAVMYTYAAAAIMTAVGTYSRTGLVALVALLLLRWWRSNRKILVGLTFVIGMAIGYQTASEQWLSRMVTIGDFSTETSALGRIAVWQWTLEFASEHPLGGGFGVYRVNRKEVPIRSGKTLEIRARAFHSMYFEVLGEHGLPGFILFVTLLAVTFFNLKKTIRHGGRLAELAIGVLDGSIVYLTAGLFIEIAFLPFLYYLIGATVVLRNLQLRESAINGSQCPPIAHSVAGRRSMVSLSSKRNISIVPPRIPREWR